MAKKKKRKIKYGRIFILLILIVSIVFGGFYAYKKLNTKPKIPKEVKELSSIDKYGYSLKENATEYYKGLFKNLEKVLSKDDVNEEEYLTLVSQMFIADFFNMDNKVNKNDVGGKQFVYKEYRSDFEKYAMDSIYKTVESNVYGNRNQELPIVEKVEVAKVKNETYKYGNSSDDNAYVVNFNITYKDDLGYQDEGSLVVIHNDNKLEIASMSEKTA